MPALMRNRATRVDVNGTRLHGSHLPESSSSRGSPIINVEAPNEQESGTWPRCGGFAHNGPFCLFQVGEYAVRYTAFGSFWKPGFAAQSTLENHVFPMPRSAPCHFVDPGVMLARKFALAKKGDQVARVAHKLSTRRPAHSVERLR
jgi:hypothetical protein